MHSAHTVLARTVKELRDLAESAEHIQNLLSGILETVPVDAYPVYDLQRLDYLKQSIDGIADFWQSLNDETAAEWSYTQVELAAEQVKLYALAERLCGISPTQSKPPIQEPSDCELF